MHITAPRWIQPDRSDASTEHSFIQSVFLWMCLGLTVSAVAAGWVVLSPGMQAIAYSPGVFLFLLLAEVVLVFIVSAGVERMAPATAATVFFTYSLLNGVTLSGLVFAYADVEIFEAFVAAAAMFGTMGVYGLLTKRDLASWGGILFMGLVGVIVASVITLFAPQPALTFAINFGGIIVFLGLTAWDVQRLKSIAAERVGEPTNAAIVGALALYLDFINIVLMFLQLTASRRRK